jgi:hypothetical protein
MNISKTIEILEALAAGCSPMSGEMLDKESVLNERDVIRALQMAIDRLKSDIPVATIEVVVDDQEVGNAVMLFREQNKSITPNNMAAFFLGTRQFKNPTLMASKLYGKYSGVYAYGQMVDYFSKYLIEKSLIPQNPPKDEAYKQVDYFVKEKFNQLSDADISQLKEKVKELGMQKTEKLAPYILDARRVYRRAYEPWSNRELELLTKAIRYTNDLDILSDCFQRGKGSIERTGQKIIWESQNEKSEQ